MKPIEFAQLMAGLASATRKDFGEEEMDFWLACFEDLPFAVVKSAFVRFVTSGDEWPTVAKIRRMATEQEHGQMHSSGDAFETVVKAVRRFGSYAMNEGLNSLDSLTRRAVEQTGGFGWYCEISADNRQIIAAQFRRAYEGLADREQSLRQTPAEHRPAIVNSPPSATVECERRGNLIVQATANNLSIHRADRGKVSA
ncbi:MAG: hypothetical protein WD648_10170 [Planctomycetaceae bacterium]